jgi:hypothetical protein
VLLPQQRVQCRLASAIAERGDQSLDKPQPLQWRIRDHDCPGISVCAT